MTRRLVLGNGVVRLTRTHRYGGTIGELARAVRAGDADPVVALLRSGGPGARRSSSRPTWAGGSRRASPSCGPTSSTPGRAVVDAARTGDGRPAPSPPSTGTGCSARTGRGPSACAGGARRSSAGSAPPIEGFAADGEWYRGRPLLATTNDYELKLFNGDTGVVVDARGPRHARRVRPGGRRAAPLAPSRLSGVQTVHAMTVHRSQGSQFARVSLLLPPAESPLLTRELFYTAVTRASESSGCSAPRPRYGPRCSVRSSGPAGCAAASPDGRW